MLLESLNDRKRFNTKYFICTKMQVRNLSLSLPLFLSVYNMQQHWRFKIRLLVFCYFAQKKESEGFVYHYTDSFSIFNFHRILGSYRNHPKKLRLAFP